MAFPNRLLDDIRARVGLANIVAKRVKLTRKGREHLGLCPFHNEKSPSFTVNEEKGFYHCFGCGAHGDVISFVMNTSGLTFPEAVERLAADAGLEMPVETPEAREQAKRLAGLHEVMEAACRWFEAQLRVPAGRAALEYLHGRGLRDETIRRFRLGFAPDGGSGLQAALAATGATEATMLEAGLLRRPDDGRAPYSFFRDRVIFPIADRQGRVIAFGGRLMGDAKAAKYINSPDTALFDKGRTLFNLANARKASFEAGTVVVTEGYMDVIALSQAGIEAAVAPLGTALTEDQIGALWRLAAEPVLCFDGDAAGQRAAGRAAERALPLLQPGKSLRFALLPPGEDPDSLVVRQGVAAMRQVLDSARPLSDVMWDMEAGAVPLDTPERRADLQARLMRRCAEIGEATVQEHYRNMYRDRLWDTFRSQRNWMKTKATGSMPVGKGVGQALSHRVRSNRRHRQMGLIAALINFPDLRDEFSESLTILDFDPDLDKFLQRLQILFTRHLDLDLAEIRTHFSESGDERLLDGVLHNDIYAIAPFASPTKALEEAREGLSKIIESMKHERQKGELSAMGRVADESSTLEEEARFLAAWQDAVENGQLLADIDKLDGNGKA
jgi:DNA primase